MNLFLPDSADSRRNLAGFFLVLDRHLPKSKKLDLSAQRERQETQQT
jgi:hypothetical protein